MTRAAVLDFVYMVNGREEIGTAVDIADTLFNIDFVENAEETIEEAWKLINDLRNDWWDEDYPTVTLRAYTAASVAIKITFRAKGAFELFRNEMIDALDWKLIELEGC